MNYEMWQRQKKLLLKKVLMGGGKALGIGALGFALLFLFRTLFSKLPPELFSIEDKFFVYVGVALGAVTVGLFLLNLPSILLLVKLGKVSFEETEEITLSVKRVSPITFRQGKYTTYAIGVHLTTEKGVYTLLFQEGVRCGFGTLRKLKDAMRGNPSYTAYKNSTLLLSVKATPGLLQFGVSPFGPVFFEPARIPLKEEAKERKEEASEDGQ